LRLISPDRPGVGGSSRQDHRTLLGYVADLTALAGHLGFTTFEVAGHSGGGAHALAAAHLLGDRVTKLALANPLAPFDEPGTSAMVKDKDLKLIFTLARAKFIAVAAAKLESKHYSKDITGFVTHCAKAWPADAAIFTDPVLVPMFETQLLAAFAQGGIGALDDMWAFLDWDFAIDSVEQPTVIFNGDCDDVLDPEMGARISARLPNAAHRIWPGSGHYGVYATQCWTEFLTALT